MTKPAEFDRCLSRPARHRSGSFALHLCWIDASMPSSAPSWRLGLVIPKRYEASAVARNTIKRRWRDAFRRGRGAWAVEFGSADLVVRMQGALAPKKPAGKGLDGRAVAKPLVRPARVRGRDRFDPTAVLASMIERLRSRGDRALPAMATGVGTS